jgi:hypothetical protein
VLSVTGELHFKILDQRHKQKVCMYVCGELYIGIFSAVIGIELTRQAVDKCKSEAHARYHRCRKKQ